ncbi:MAG: PP2C family protein-serine/threonine phosphatase [Phycisphaerales bacterium]
METRGPSSESVVVVGGTQATLVADALRSATWPRRDAPRIESCAWPDEATLATLKASVFVVVHDADARERIELVCEQAAINGVPAVVLGPDAPSSACLRFEHGTDATVVAAAVAGLLARGGEVDQLSRELALTSRVADGVQGELTRIDEELQMAALLQQEFLPRMPPVVEGVEVAAMWRPAGSVSGDLYEIVRLDEYHVGVFLADAVGHGMPAALMAMQLCRTLHTRDHHDRFDRVVPPAEALSRLNALMADRQGRVGRYASAIYAVVNCRDRVARVASAGAPPPIVVGRDGHVRILPSSGPLLGMLAEQEYEEVVVELADDDHLLLHSDGFEAAFHDDPAPGAHGGHLVPRHLDEVARLRESANCVDAIHALAQRLDDEQGSLHPSDDCTLVLLRARPRISAAAA